MTSRKRRTGLIAGGAVGAGAVIAGALLLTGLVGDDDGDGSTTGPGEQNEFVAGEDDTLVAEGLAFEPATLTLEVGDAVAFENRDSVVHTFTADDGLFDSREVEPDGRYGYTLPRAGEFDFHCEIHPLMTGTLIVED